ncbi:hypothetical protein RYX36_002980 [Vicia faba]
MGSNSKRRRFGSSFSLTSLDDSSVGVVACGEIVNDQSITQNPTSDNDVVLEGKQFSLDLSASNVATKKTSPTMLGEFLEACRWCKTKIQEEVYMYGIFSAFCSPKCRQNQMISEKYIVDVCSKQSRSAKEEAGGINKK